MQKKRDVKIILVITLIVVIFLVYLVYFYSQPSGLKVASINGIYPVQSDDLIVSILYRKDHIWSKDFHDKYEDIKVELLFEDGTNEKHIIDPLAFEVPRYWDILNPVKLYNTKIPFEIIKKNNTLVEIKLVNEQNEIISQNKCNMKIYAMENIRGTMDPFLKFMNNIIVNEHRVEIKIYSQNQNNLIIEDIGDIKANMLSINKLKEWKYVYFPSNGDGYSLKERNEATKYPLSFPLTIKSGNQYILSKELTLQELESLKSERNYVFMLLKHNDEYLYNTEWAEIEPFKVLKD
jgi:hypothetical protein